MAAVSIKLRVMILNWVFTKLIKAGNVELYIGSDTRVIAGPVLLTITRDGCQD